jgi:hypothetical protein
MLGTFCDCSDPVCGGGLVEDCIDSVDLMDAGLSAALVELARLDWAVELVWTVVKDSPPRAEEEVVVVVVTGELGTTGDDGESRSLEPDESFVRFFFKNPRVGMKAGYLSVEREEERRGASNKEADKRARRALSRQSGIQDDDPDTSAWQLPGNLD